MDFLIIAGAFIAGGGAGVAVGYALAKARAASENASAIEKYAAALASAQAALNAEKEKLTAFENARAALVSEFKALSADALRESNRSFLELATQNFETANAKSRGELEKRSKEIEGILKPVSEKLKEVDEHVRNFEKERKESQGTLAAQLSQLDRETKMLVNALRRPEVRGKWGELTLRRVAELAGMVEHCDFDLQETVSASGGEKKLRPDMVVNLPGGRRIAVDAKMSFDAYLEAQETALPDARENALVRHAAQVEAKMNDLAGKKYFESIGESPLFVVMFVPYEAILAAALERKPGLIEDGFERKVIIATPPTLIALLLSVAHGWQQAAVEKNAMEIRDLGKELYDRLCVFVSHLDDLSKSLDKCVKSYNAAAGSLNSRVLVSADRLKKLGAAPASAEICELKEIELRARRASADEKSE